MDQNPIHAFGSVGDWTALSIVLIALLVSIIFNWAEITHSGKWPVIFDIFTGFIIGGFITLLCMSITVGLTVIFASREWPQSRITGGFIAILPIVILTIAEVKWEETNFFGIGAFWVVMGYILGATLLISILL